MSLSISRGCRASYSTWLCSLWSEAARRPGGCHQPKTNQQTCWPRDEEGGTNEWKDARGIHLDLRHPCVGGDEGLLADLIAREETGRKRAGGKHVAELGFHFHAPARRVSPCLSALSTTNPEVLPDVVFREFDSSRVRNGTQHHCLTHKFEDVRHCTYRL